MYQLKFIVRTVGGKDLSHLLTNIPVLEICEDEDKNAMNTFRKSLVMAGDNPIVHMEDDVILDPEFYTKIQKEIQLRPDDVIQFFSMRKEDLTVGSRYINGSKFMMNQCYYIPRNTGMRLLSFMDGWGRYDEHPTGYDILMADFFKANKIKYWNVVPNLVDHEEAVSRINPRRSSKRQSLTFNRKKIDIRIMAVPSREPHVRLMCEKLGIDHDTCVIYDVDKKGPRWTSEQCWLDKPHSDDITHRVVLQDDILVAKDFELVANEIVNKYPNNFFSLHCARLRWVHKFKDTPYLIVNGYNAWGQANICELALAKTIIEWAVKEFGDNHDMDEGPFIYWSEKYSNPIMTTIPSLVQHNEPTTSVLGYNNIHKVSKVWLGEDVELLEDYNWNSDRIGRTNSMPCTVTHEEALIRYGVKR